MLSKVDPLLWITFYFRSFRDYGEAVLKHLENTTSSDPKLQKAPVNHEGVSVSHIIFIYFIWVPALH